MSNNLFSYSSSFSFKFLSLISVLILVGSHSEISSDSVSVQRHLTFLVQKRDGECVFTQEKTDTQGCHIIPKRIRLDTFKKVCLILAISEDKIMELFDFINSPANMISLTPSMHVAFDNGSLYVDIVNDRFYIRSRNPLYKKYEKELSLKSSLNSFIPLNPLYFTIQNL